MIFNTTHPNQNFILYSNKLLGKPYSIFNKIKMNGVGSARFTIAEISEKLKTNKKQFSELSHGNIEIRPSGILVHYTNRLERFSWCIPYYRLVVYNSDFFSLHAEGSFIKFFKNKNYTENKKFISKMLDHKNEFLNIGYYDG